MHETSGRGVSVVGRSGVCGGPGRRGFTLVELLVVIGVIALLVGITLVVGQSVLSGAKANNTRDTLKTLDAAVDAYIADLGRGPRSVAKLPFETGVGTEDVLPVWDGVVGTPDLNDAEEVRGATLNSGGLLLLALRGSGAAEGVLAQLRGESVVQRAAAEGDTLTSSTTSELRNEFLTVLDGFGRPIRGVHPAFDGVLVGAGDPRAGLSDVALMLPQRNTVGDEAVTQNIDRDRLPARVTSAGLRRNDLTDSDGGTSPSDRPYFYSVGPDGAAGADADFDGKVAQAFVDRYPAASLQVDEDPNEDGRRDNVYSVRPNFTVPVAGAS